MGGFTWPCNQTISVILKVGNPWTISSSISWESLTNYQVLFQSYLLHQQAVFAGSSGENLWARKLPNHNRIKDQIPNSGQWHRCGLSEYMCVQVCMHCISRGTLVPVCLASFPYLDHCFTYEKASLTSIMLISRAPSRSQMRGPEALGRAVSGRWASGGHQDHHHTSY